ncbi:hypothetical protein EXU48_15695 [Occultella glacieicola]|uniref:HK97 gp10 family phage protein n=1 Tax=Occultella glacieicola TaxID=2518684 RepID=A0ABY2E5U5_9MICO|nr:hypothetical protein [Occultella glacieicola]TDE91588.1 hypothetical protein EXU48_15695 [Occultella glacieicola]
MLSVEDHRELQAAVLALKAAPRALRTAINKTTRETMNPEWKALVSANASGLRNPGSRVLTSGAKIKAGNPPVAQAAQSRRGIGEGKRLVPNEHYFLWEFGVGNPEKVSTYTRKSKNGGTHQVRRRTNRGKPRLVKAGRVFYPAFAELAPRMVSLWVQTIVKIYADALEGNRG